MSALHDALTAAIEAEGRARQSFAAPYSGHDAMVRFYEARGYVRGLARAVELSPALAMPASAEGPVGRDAVILPPGPFGTVLADPPWRFVNRTGKVAPEHRRLSRYATMSVAEIAALPVGAFMADQSHCYLWVPNALLDDGMRVLASWGFTYKTMLVWHKIRKDGGSDGRGVGFYFRTVTEPVLFGVRGKLRTLAPGRRQVNLLATQKREHSRKPDELYPVIEACSPGPFLELFARHPRPGWVSWGDQLIGPSHSRTGPGIEPGPDEQEKRAEAEAVEDRDG